MSRRAERERERERERVSERQRDDGYVRLGSVDGKSTFFIGRRHLALSIR
jgi:hypothetical protein